ncbi:hypothetical protein NENIHHPF_00100 [Enterococcus phage EF_FB]
MVSESYPNSLNKALVYIIHIIQSRKTLSQCNVNSKETESESSRVCERVGRRDVRASRSTRKVSRSVRKALGRRRSHGGRGLWEGLGVTFPRAGGARDSQPLTSFGKSDIIASGFIFPRKSPIRRSDSCSDKLSDGHSDSYPKSIPSIDVRKLSSYLS